MYLLFTYELIEVKLTDQIDQNTIIIQKQSQQGEISGKTKVIKNGKDILELLQAAKKLNLQVISYSAKSKQTSSAIYQAINLEIPNQWIFVDNNSKKYPEIIANRAFMSVDKDICYGEGFSQVPGKAQLRLAIHSALRNLDKDNFIILEKSIQEVQTLKKQKYPFVFNGIPTIEDFMQCHRTAIHKKKEAFQNDIQEMFGNHVPHNLEQLLYDPSLILHKKMFFNEVICRTPKSKSICSMIIKNKYDNQIYIQKTQKTRQFGGDFHSEQLENIELAAEVNHFCGVKVLPHYRSAYVIKYSLLPTYEKKKAMFSLKPYIKGLKCLGSALNTREDAQILMKQGLFKEKTISGLGNLLLMSLICGQSFKVKSFLQQVAFIDHKDYLEVYRFDFYDAFCVIDQSIKKQTIRVSENTPLFSLKDINKRALSQMENLYFQIQKKVSLLSGLFTHYKWQFPKSNIFNFFKDRLKFTNSLFHFEGNEEISSIKQIPKLRPIEYNLIVGDKDQWFTRKPEYPYEIGGNEENQYVTLMRKGQSFELHSPLPQLQLLLKWIARKWGQVQYISFLSNSKADYINLSKKLKLQTDSDKKTRLLVADHCQLETYVLTSHRPVKTIFITRLRRVQTDNLPVIIQLNCHMGSLLDSQEELFRVLVDAHPDRQLCLQGQGTYGLFEDVLNTWIANKCEFYNIPLQSCLSHCRKVAYGITNNRNRIAQLDCKELYCLPIEKNKQRIYFVHDIYQFLRAKHLIDDIMSGNWTGKLEVQQLQHFSKWIKKTKPEVNQQVKISLLHYVRQKCKSSQDRQDSLQLLKVLTNQIFLQHHQHYTYSRIQQIVQNKNYYLVLTQNSLFGYRWESSQSDFSLKESYKSIQLDENRLVLSRVVLCENREGRNQEDITSSVQGSSRSEIAGSSDLQKKTNLQENIKVQFEIYQLVVPFDASCKQKLVYEIPSGCINRYLISMKGQLVLFQGRVVTFVGRQQKLTLPEQIVSMSLTPEGYFIASSNCHIYKISSPQEWEIVFDATNLNTKIKQVRIQSQTVQQDGKKSQLLILVIILAHSRTLYILQLSTGQKFTFPHTGVISSAVVNWFQGTVYSMVKDDDVLYVSKLITGDQKMFYQVCKDTVGLFASQKVLVIQGQGYVKKITMQKEQKYD